MTCQKPSRSRQNIKPLKLRKLYFKLSLFKVQKARFPGRETIFMSFNTGLPK
jgi:hypothetical protein